MLQALWRLSGLQRQLAGLTASVERKTTEAANQVKAAAIRFVLALCFTVAALAFLLMALVAGLIALYTWLEILFGPMPALGIIAGVLAGIALIFAITALVVARGQSRAGAGLAPPERAPAAAAGVAGAGLAPPPPPTDGAGADLIESFVDLIKRLASRQRTGSPLLDEVITRATPSAEAATDDIVSRAANLVRTGDRTTMIAVLGASAVLGWLLVKAGDRAGDRKS